MIFKQSIQVYCVVIFVICIAKSTVAHGSLFNLQITDLGFERSNLGEISLILAPLSFLGVFILTPFLKKPLTIFIFYTVPGLAVCNVLGSAIIGHYNYLNESGLIYYSVMMWTGVGLVQVRLPTD